MVEYKCDKCDKCFSKKSNFTYHINRKNPCILAQKDIAKPSSDPPKSRQIKSSDENIDQNNNQTSKHTCSYCNFSFTRQDSLRKHLAGRCKIKNKDVSKENTDEIYNKLLAEMTKMMEEKDKKINNLITEVKKLKNKTVLVKGAKKTIKANNNNTNSNNTNNINNVSTANIGQFNQQNINVKLVAFKKEDLSFITDDVYKKILNKGFMSVPTLVEYIHFNKDKPQYRNIYISNMRDKYALVYDGENWQLRDREMILKELIDDKTDVLSIKFEEMIATLDEFTIRKFQRFLDEGDDDDNVCKIKDDLRMILYNNRKMTDALTII